MGLLRYIVQGFGWEVGAHAAREGIDALEARTQREAPPSPPSPREQRRLAKLEKARAQQAKRDAARKQADIERQLAALKKKA